MHYSRSLIEGSVGDKFVRFALPVLFTNAMQALNSSINSMWVAHYLGNAALAATSNANSVTMLPMGIIFGLSMVTTILVAQYIGAGEVHEAKRVVHTVAITFAGISILIAALGLIFAERLLVAMKTPAGAMELSVTYLRVMFLALPCTYMFVFLVSVLRGGGDSKGPFCFMLLATALDVFLNPMLMLGFGPLPHLGIAGAAWATVVSQATGLGALITYLYWRRHPLCLRSAELLRLRIKWPILSTLLRKGLTVTVHMLSGSLTALLTIALVNRFGVDTVAAFGASLQLWMYFDMLPTAIGVTVTTMVAQNWAAKRWDRVKTVTRLGTIYSLLCTGSTALAANLWGSCAYRLFLVENSPAMHIAIHINRIVAWSYVFSGVTMVLFGVVRATGAVVVPLLITALLLLFVRFIVAGTLLDHMGADVIWWSFPAASALILICAVLYYRYGRWQTQESMVITSESA